MIMDFSSFLNIPFLSTIILPVIAIGVAIWSSHSTSVKANKQIKAITDVCRLQVEGMIIQVEQNLVDLESEKMICSRKLQVLNSKSKLTTEEQEERAKIEKKLDIIRRKKMYCFNQQNALLSDQNILNKRK